MSGGMHRTVAFLLALLVLAVGAARETAGGTPQVAFTVSRFDVDGDNPLSEGKTRAVLAPYLGQHRGLAGLEDAARALDRAIKERGYAFHRVVLPPQTLQEGTVRLRIRTVNLDMVVVADNRHFSAENVTASLTGLKSGHPVNTRRIARDLAVANAHPARQLSVFFRQAAAPEAIDATVRVKDRRPYAVFASVANTGDADTGRTRIAVGAQHSNLLDRDHSLTASYTTSPESFSDVSQYGLHYRMPVYPLAAWVSAFYSRSKIDQGQVGDFFDVSGKGKFAGLSVDHRLMPFGTYSHKIGCAVQDRLFENDSIFSGTPIGVDVRSRPVSVQYSGRVEKLGWTGGFYLSYAANIETGAGNDDAAYGASRQGADARWYAVRYGADLDARLPGNWRMRSRMIGQFADQPLIPGEQMGLGGAGSVRGFKQREATADGGQMLSTEVWTPDLWRRVHLVGFMDAGWRQWADPEPVDGQDSFLAGTGLGLRWFWKERLSVSLDAAYALDGSDETEAGDGRIHFAVFFRY